MVFFDDDYFKWTNEEMKVKTTAFITAMERVVGAENGSFLMLTKLFE